jgi:hypothetical protein
LTRAQQIILAGFVNDTKHTLALGFGVPNDTIDLPGLQRRLITLILDTDYEAVVSITQISPPGI